MKHVSPPNRSSEEWAEARHAWPPQIRRVVFAAPRIPELSGGSTAIVNLSDALAQLGVEVRHISIKPGMSRPTHPTFTLIPRESLHAGPTFRGASGPLGKAKALPLAAFKVVDRRLRARALRRELAGLGRETVLVFTHALARRELAAAGWQPTPGGPWLIGQHHSQFASLSDESWLIEALPRLFSDVDGFTALTDEDAGSFGELIGVPAFGMPNPLRPAGLPPRHPEKLAVALARYSPEKQLDVMIRAFSQATEAPSLNGWKLELHGEGPTRPQLEAMIESLGIADRVRLAGPTTDIQSVLARAQVNLLTSRYEGFGMSILEAADAGVPSVVFDCSAGVRSLVPQGAGLLVPPNDEEAFAASLRTLLLDPELRSAMGRAAQHHSASFSPARIAQRWGHMLARVTGA